MVRRFSFGWLVRARRAAAVVSHAEVQSLRATVSVQSIELESLRATAEALRSAHEGIAQWHVSAAETLRRAGVPAVDGSTTDE